MTTTNVYVGPVGEAFNRLVDAKASLKAAQQNVVDSQTLLANATEARLNAQAAQSRALEVLENAQNARNAIDEAIRTTTNPTLLENLNNLLTDVTTDDQDMVITYFENGIVDNGGNTQTATRNLTKIRELIDNNVAENIREAQDYITTAADTLAAAQTEYDEAKSAFDAMIPDDINKVDPNEENDMIEESIAAHTAAINNEVNAVNSISDGVQSTTDWILEELRKNSEYDDDDSQEVEPVEGDTWHYFVGDTSLVFNDNDDIILDATSFLEIAQSTKDASISIPDRRRGNIAIVAPEDTTVTGQVVDEDPSVWSAAGYEITDDQIEGRWSDISVDNGAVFKIYIVSSYANDDNPAAKVVIDIRK